MRQIDEDLLKAIWSFRFPDVVKAVEAGADVNVRTRDGFTPLMLAASFSYIETLEFLIERGADIHAKAYYGATALSRAVRAGACENVGYLILRGAKADFDLIRRAILDGCEETAEVMFNGMVDRI